MKYLLPLFALLLICQAVAGQKELSQKDSILRYKKLQKVLENIYDEDQSERLKIDSVIKNYGIESKEMELIDNKLTIIDSINLLKVTKIIDQYGWLSSKEVGEKG